MSTDLQLFLPVPNVELKIKPVNSAILCKAYYVTLIYRALGSFSRQSQTTSQFYPYLNKNDLTPLLFPFLTVFSGLFISVISPSPITIDPLTLPKISFAWPEEAHNIATTLVSNGFQLTSRGKVKDDHLPMITGVNNHVGREEYSLYTYKKHSNPVFEDPETGFPDLAKLLSPPDAVKSQYVNSAVAKPTENDELLIVSLIHFGPNACGWYNTVHGGMISSVADAIMFTSYRETGRAGVTGSLNVSFKNPTPANSLLIGVTCCQLQGPRKGESRMSMFDSNLMQVFSESTALMITPAPWQGKTMDEIEEYLRMTRPQPSVKEETTHAPSA